LGNIKIVIRRDLIGQNNLQRESLYCCIIMATTAAASSLAIKTFTACTATLYLKFFITTGIQAGKTFDSGGRAPEDVQLRFLAKGKPKQGFGLHVDEKNESIIKARETETRWRRIIMNDLESIPFALIVFGSGILANANDKVLSCLMIIYTLARIGHTWAFANAIQPHRALFWSTGIICILGGAATALAGAWF
jgi:glutathione S-transferase